MLNHVYIIRIDDKDHSVTTSSAEFESYLDKLRNMDDVLVELPGEFRSFTTTINFRYL